jgi:tRNA modification GTPase
MRIEGLRTLLPVRLAVWAAPRSYTGQDVTEIHLTGSAPLSSLVLAACLRRGARHAQPGEFTLRAFLSGRIDLTRAEAVLGVIDAHNPAQLEAALEQLAGGLSTPVTRMRDHLLDVVAHLEANLDFTEEPDVDPLGRDTLVAELERSAEELNNLGERLTARDRPLAMPRVVLAGPPNAGKSRLFNALLGTDRAIVSAQAGTTRDFLASVCDCGGIDVELIDTAGIEQGNDSVATQAQAMRASQAERADLVLECHSADTALAQSAGTSNPANVGQPLEADVRLESLTYDDVRLESLTYDGVRLEGPTYYRGPSATPLHSDFRTGIDRILNVWTKGDLVAPEASLPGFADWIVTSAATGQGLDDLRAAIANRIRLQDRDGDLPAGTAARCRGSILNAESALRSAAHVIQTGGGDELVAFDLRQAVDELGKVVGAVFTDDILDRIFRRFCIGK